MFPSYEKQIPENSYANQWLLYNRDSGLDLIFKGHRVVTFVSAFVTYD